jgi:dienelactone hydrolase
MKTETLDYSNGETTSRGYLATPERSGKRPGIIVCHEAPGLDENPKRRARMLAELGYVALAVDMYGGGKVGVGEEAGKLMAEVRSEPGRVRRRARAALDALAKQPGVDTTWLAAIGYCFGGFTALELARTGAPMVGVVSFHGLLTPTDPAAPGGIKGKLLICTGSADPLVPPPQVLGFEEEMTKAGVDWQVITYSKAKHAFTNPHADKLNRPGFGYDANADRRSWDHMRGFFAEVFGEA